MTSSGYSVIIKYRAKKAVTHFAYCYSLLVNLEVSGLEEMEEKTIREYYYNENKNKMDVINKNFKRSYIFNFYFNIVFSFVSLGGLYLWISFTNAGIKMAHILEEEIGTIHFPWMALSAPIAPLIAIMTFFANALLIKKLNRKRRKCLT